MASGPLDGIRVIDFSRFMIGPLATTILGDMGADVIMIEDPLSRSAAAGWYNQRANDKRRLYGALQRNKRSIFLDLKQPRGREILHKLVKSADVVVDEFRPGAMKRLGADYPTLKKLNPRIVACSMSGYGQTGPYRDIPGFDPNWLAVSGFLDLFGASNGEYVLPGAPVGDYTCTMFGVVGIMMALYMREKTGKGQFVDVGAADALTYWVGARHWPLWLAEAKKPLRGKRCTNIWRTKDGGHMVFSFGIKVFWDRFVEATGIDKKYLDYWEDRGSGEVVDYLPNAARIKKRIAESNAAVQKAMLTHTRDEWARIFKKADVCFSPIYDLAESIRDPHLKAREMVVEFKHPSGKKTIQVGNPIKLSGASSSIRLPAPKAGEHTAAVLKEIGFSAKEIQALNKAGVTG